MTTLERLDAAQLKAVVVRYRDALKDHKEALNRLNVYPVPDGDTGTNMALTLESVVTELESCESLADVCKGISHGSLMGARATRAHSANPAGHAGAYATARARGVRRQGARRGRLSRLLAGHAPVDGHDPHCGQGPGDAAPRTRALLQNPRGGEAVRRKALATPGEADGAEAAGWRRRRRR